MTAEGMGLEKFLLVFLRLSVLLPLLPLFGGATFPPQFRIGAALAMAWFLAPIVSVSTSGPLFLRISSEILLGAALGFSVRLVFNAVLIASQWIGFAMGISVASAFDPTAGSSLTPVGQFLNMLAIVVFFALDMHHDVIIAIARTFDIVPSTATLVGGVIEITRLLFTTAFRLAAPILIIELMANLVLAFVARAMPQANLLAVGLPINLGMGFIGLMLLIPFFVQAISRLKFIPVWR
jgi:flagellar biosynthetic protein FliR